MDNASLLITISVSICVIIFGILAVMGAIYGILVWYPRAREEKVEALKGAGRQSEATILRLPDQELENYPGRRAVLEIAVPGLPSYEVGKVFSIPVTRWPRS